ncbi:hypothetical protein [Pseudoduganella sp. R-43]|uniref:hypothetical protein n=1 Tax=Pseudoduganella sp. R-43 TaxID=3404063 RepID=UPI003CF3271C
MAVVSKWICGSCVAKDVLFAVHTGRETVFVICAACGATQFSPERGDAEFIQMDGTARELTGNWVMATHEVVRSAGYESQFDVEVWHFTKGSLKVFLALEYEICDPTICSSRRATAGFARKTLWQPAYVHQCHLYPIL